MITMGREMRTRENPNVPVPDSATTENTPTNWHFDDVDQVFMRSDWSENAYRTRLWAGSVFGKQGSKIAKRYNWAHCPINQGSFILSKGKHEIILEAGWTREYRRTPRPTTASSSTTPINGAAARSGIPGSNKIRLPRWSSSPTASSWLPPART